MIRINMKRSKLITFSTVISLAVVGIFSHLTLTAASNGKNMQIGTAPLSEGVNTSDSTIVYFDTYGDKWAVVGYDGNSGLEASGAVTLLSDSTIDTTVFSNSNNEYAGSLLQSSIESKLHRFSSEELDAIRERDFTGGGVNRSESSFDESSLKGENTSGSLWPLSIAETESLDNSLRAINMYWWLRTQGSSDDKAMFVNRHGVISDYAVGSSFGARVAFYLEMSSVAFTSAAEGGKISGTTGPDSLTAIDDYTGNEWKLTLFDSSRNFTAQRTDSGNVPAGEDLSINYSGASAGNNEYVSAILLNTSGELLYYGRLVNNSESGEVNITIPSGLTDGDYVIKVYSEKCNGDKKTDFASSFVTINITVGERPAAPSQPDPPQSNPSQPDPSQSDPQSPSSVESDDKTEPENTYSELESLLDEAVRSEGNKTVVWNKGDKLPFNILKYLKKHPELTLIFNYTYKGVDYSITIRSENVVISEDIPWYGPEYLYGMCMQKPSVSAQPVMNSEPSEKTENLTRTYTVMPGDNLTFIARRLGTTVKKLVKDNNIKNPNIIRVGRVLVY